MAQQQIKFTIRQDGTVSEEVLGVIGDGCQELTKTIDEKLGEISHREEKPEYYLAQPIENFWKNTTDVTLQHYQD